MRKIGLFTSLVLLLGIGTVSAQDATQYIRYQQGRTQNDGALQIAVETWTTPSGATIDLYGVVHIADSAYYRQVQLDLSAYDAVLYEGVGLTRQVAEARERNPNGNRSSGLSSVQRTMGTVLGLEFQMDSISYIGSNMVHADMGENELPAETRQQVNPLERFVSPETLKRLAPLVELGSTLLDQYFAQNPEIRNGLKTQFASQLAGADMTKQLPPQLYQSIVIDRNAVVMRVLAQQLQQHPGQRRISIFYGAAHMPDFQQRFTQLGYTRTGVRYMTAWNIGQGAVEGNKSGKKGKAVQPMKKSNNAKKRELQKTR